MTSFLEGFTTVWGECVRADYSMLGGFIGGAAFYTTVLVGLALIVCGLYILCEIVKILLLKAESRILKG